MATSEEPPPHATSSELSGTARDVIQARDIRGGIHFHGLDEGGAPIPAQLPGDVYGFVNRMVDMEVLNQVLGSPGQVAVCVVTGTPGIGKTALAVHWAHRVRQNFADGQLYVNLRGYDAEEPIPPERALGGFLTALGVAPGAVPADLDERSSLYRSLLSDREMLIVLDNAATAAQVRPLLPGTGRCRVLITSRGLLSGLATRGGARRVTLDLFSEAESIELLRSTSSQYRTADGAEEIAELARLCARLPLALRIAGERAATRPRMTLSALIADLRNESSLWSALTTDDSDDADAIRSVFAWSYRVLPEPTARLFRLLGTFPGADFGSEVGAALTGLTVSAVRRLLGSLTDAHLVEQTGDDRYQLHDLLRAYAADLAVQIDPPAEIAAAQSAVLDWYLRCASQLASQDSYAIGHRQVTLTPPAPGSTRPGFADYGQAVEWFHREQANITFVVRSAARAGATPPVWQIPALLRHVYDRERAFDDWFTTARLGLAAARMLDSDDGQLFLLNSLGRASFSINDMAEADTFYSAALELAERLGDHHEQAVVHNVIGLLEMRRHRMREAIEHLERCGEFCREYGFRELTVNPATNLAQALLAFGRPEEALTMAELAVATNRDVGSRQAEMYALLYLSEAQLTLGSVADAERSVEAAFRLAADSGSRAEEGIALLYLSGVQIALDDAAAALTSCQDAAIIARRSGDRQREARSLAGAGAACRALGRFEEAAGFHHTALLAWRSMRDAWQTAVTSNDLIQDITTGGLAGDAQSLRDEALRLIMPFTDPAAQRLRESLIPSTGSAGAGPRATG